MTAPGPSRAKKALRWIARILLWAPIVVGVLVIAGLLWMRTDAGRTRIRQLALDALAETIPGLDFARIGGNYTSSLWLEEVALRTFDGRPAVSAKRVELHFNLLALLRRRIDLSRLDIVEPTVKAWVDRDGTLNLTKLVRPSQKPSSNEPFAWTIVLGRALLTEGRLFYVDARGERTDASLDLLATGDWSPSGGRATVERIRVSLHQAERQLLLRGSFAGALHDDDRIELKIPRLSLRGLTTQGEVLLSGTATGALHERIALRLDSRFGAKGNLRIRGGVGLRAERENQPWYELAIQVDNLSPHLFAREFAPGHVDGKITLTGEGVPLAPRSHAALGIDLAPSAVQGIPLDVFRVDVVTENDSWQLRGATLHAPGAQLRLRGQGTTKRVAVELEATLDAQAARALPVAGVLPPGLQGLGRFQLRAQGPLPPSRVTVQGTGALSKLKLNQLRIAAANLELHATGLPERPRAKLDVRIDRLQQGTTSVSRTEVHADVGMTGKMIDGRITAKSTGLVADAGKLDEAAIDIESRSGALRLQAAAKGPKANGFLVGSGRVRLDRAEVRLESAALHFPLRRFRLAGPATIAFRQNELVSVSGLRVELVSRQLGGTYGLDATYYLARRPPTRAELRLRIRDGHYWELGDIDVDVEGRLKSDQANLKLDGKIGRGRFPISAAFELPMSVDKKGAPKLAMRGPIGVRVDARNVHLQELPLPVSLTRRGLRRATVDLHVGLEGDIAAPRGTAELMILDAHIRDLPTLTSKWKLTAGERQSILRGTVHIHHQEVASLEAKTALALSDVMVAERRAEQKLPDEAVQGSLHLQSIDLRWLEKYDPRFARVVGVVHGKVGLAGTIGKPTATLELAVDQAAVDRIRFGQIAITGSGSPAAQKANLVLKQVAGGMFRAEVEHRTSPSSAIDAKLDANAFDLGFVRVFLPNIREVGGRLDAHLALTGPMDKLASNGRIVLRDGKIGPAGQPTIRGLQAALRLSPEQLTIEEAKAVSGGTFVIHGTVGLEGLAPRQVALDANAKDFVLAWSGVTGAKLDGRFIVRGAVGPRSVTGRLDVPKASVWLPKLEKDQKLHRTTSRDDVVFLDAKGRPPDPKDARPGGDQAPQKVEVAGRIGSFFVRGKDVDLDLEGDLRVANAADGRPALSGKVEARRGHIMIQGRRWKVERTVLLFNGDPDHPEPQLDIRLTHAFSDAAVAINLRGTPKAPKIDLTSEPALDPAQVVSLIVTGRAGGAPSSGKFDPTGMIGTLVLGKIADKIAPEIGVDIIRVEQRSESSDKESVAAETDTRVEVGKYLSENIYLSYVHIFGSDPRQNTNEANVEYRFARRWVLETAFGDAGVGGVDVFWTYRY